MTVDEALEFAASRLEQGQFSKIQETVFRQSWNGLSYTEIAIETGYDAGYIKDTGSKLWQLLSETFGDRVTKNNFQTILKRHQVNVAAIAAPQIKATARQDWGEAIDVSVFYGRTQELATLQEWIVQEQCRLVAVLGMGGMGKTTLAAKLTAQIQEKFDYLIWRSLRNAPPIQDILADLIHLFSQEPLPETVDRSVAQVIDYLRQHRCLVVLDNVETILDSGDRAGCYREGYEGYGQLLRSVADSHHQSCVLLTTREQPKGLSIKQGRSLPVRALQLTGLETAEGQEIFRAKGFVGSEQWNLLIQHYQGNPLALKIAATSIQALFDGDVVDFLTQGTAVFGDIWNLLDQQFSRLSDSEKQVMYWLAINREAVSFTELRTDAVPLSQRELLETLELLQQRSLIEKATLKQGQSTGFTQQPVVMEYVTTQLIEQVTQEIISGSIQYFNSHTLVKVQSEDYIRDAQILFIAKPILDRLFEYFRNKKRIVDQLNQILSNLHQQRSPHSGYACGNLINLFSQLDIDLKGYDFSNLTVWQADLRTVNLRYADFTDADLEKTVLIDAFRSALSIAFSPTGDRFVTAGAGGEIRVWSVAEMKPLVTCKSSGHWLFSAAFSPDGEVIASAGGDDRLVWLWDAQTGQCLRTLREHTGRTMAVAFSPDGLLASASDDQTIRLWDADAGVCVRTIQSPIGQIRSVAFSSDGQMLAGGSDDGAIAIWTGETGEPLTWQAGHYIRSIAFSPNENLLASGGDDAQVRLWEVNTGQQLRTFQGHAFLVRSVQFSPDGSLLVSSSLDQTVRLWDVQTGNCLRILQGHSSCVWSVGLNQTGDLISTSDDQTIRLWDVQTGQCRKTLRGYSSTVWSLAFSPRQDLLCSGGGDAIVRLWNLQTGECKSLAGHKQVVFAVAYSPSGDRVASGSTTIRIWDTSTGACLRTLNGHTNWIWSIAFSTRSANASRADERLLASGSGDQTVKLWDTQTGECLRTLQAHTSYVWCVAFSPCNSILASSSDDKTIRLWDVETGACLHTLQGHARGIWSIAFHPQTPTLVSASDDGTVRIWDVEHGKCLKVLQGHTDIVRAIAYSSDGQMIASGSDDGTVRLWDQHGECLKVSSGHTDIIRSIAFHPQKPTIAITGESGIIQLWDIETGESCKLSHKRPYEGMTITGATGLTEAQKLSLIALGAVDQES